MKKIKKKKKNTRHSQQRGIGKGDTDASLLLLCILRLVRFDALCVVVCLFNWQALFYYPGAVAVHLPIYLKKYIKKHVKILLTIHQKYAFMAYLPSSIDLQTDFAHYG